MSSVITCPKCQNRLAVPEQFQGKAVRCPKCRAVIPPAASQPVEEAVAVEPVPTRKAGTAAKSAPAKGAPVGLIIAGVVVGVLLLVCAGVAGLGYFVYRGMLQATAEMERERAAAEARARAVPVQEGRPQVIEGGGFPMDILPHIDRHNLNGLQPAGPPLALPPLPAAIEIKPAVVKEETTYNLPDAVAGVAVGGGGRFLVLHLHKQHKLGIFDVNEAKITGYISVEDGPVSLTAGMNKLLVYQPSGGLLLRYDLLSRQREKVAKLTDAPTQVAAFCLGSASSGPLLVSANDRPGGQLYDIETLEPMPLSDNDKQVLGGGPCWVSADGRVFAFNGASTCVLEGGRVHQTQGFLQATCLQPGPDGKLVYTAGYGVLTNRLQPVEDAAYSARDNNNMSDYLFLPAAHGPFYMQVHFKSPLRQMFKEQQRQLKQAGVGILLPRMPGQPLHKDDPEQGITLYIEGQREPLAQLPGIKVPTSEEMQAMRGIGMERSVHLVPRARLLIVLAGSRDKLLLYPLDPEAALEKSGIKYLLITSQPPAEATRGQEFVYQVTAKAKAPGVKYRLDSWPQGMGITPEGKITWKVPADLVEKQVDVIVNVRDGEGQEKFHTFTLAVR
jgi:hypothetical protein